MAANVESMFYVRETPWHGLGIKVNEAPASKEALIVAGLDWSVLQEPIYTETEELIAGYKEYGTVLFSSHILESITLTSDRVLVLEDGQIRRSFEGSEINAANIREALHDENEF